MITTLALLAFATATPQTDPAAPPPAPTQTDDRRTEKALAKRLEQIGGMYEILGSCAGSMDAAEVESTLRQAQSDEKVGPYLLQRYEKGFRHPKDDDWCHRNMTRAVERL